MRARDQGGCACLREVGEFGEQRVGRLGDPQQVLVLGMVGSGGMFCDGGQGLGELLEVGVEGGEGGLGRGGVGGVGGGRLEFVQHVAQVGCHVSELFVDGCDGCGDLDHAVLVGGVSARV